MKIITGLFLLLIYCSCLFATDRLISPRDFYLSEAKRNLEKGRLIDARNLYYKALKLGELEGENEADSHRRQYESLEQNRLGSLLKDAEVLPMKGSQRTLYRDERSGKKSKKEIASKKGKSKSQSAEEKRNKKTARLYKQAEAYERMGRYDLAYERVEDILQVSPNEDRAMKMAARLEAMLK